MLYFDPTIHCMRSQLMEAVAAIALLEAALEKIVEQETGQHAMSPAMIAQGALGRR